MNRFFTDKIKAGERFILLDEAGQLHHLRDVLRIKVSEDVEVFDNSGNEYTAKVVEIGARQAKLEIRKTVSAQALGASLTVACAIPKKVKMDDIVDKLTQLGVECIIPLETDRVVVRLNKQKKADRLQRWEKIALSAAKQSHGAKLTQVKPISRLEEVFSGAGSFDLKLIPTLEGERKTLKNVLNQHGKTCSKIIALIGPEGDFTPEEISLARESGFLPVSLGNRVLRVDTAAIAVASFIKLNETH